MRLRSWLSGLHAPEGSSGERACGRWERQVLLAASEDLSARDAERLRRHLEVCERCRSDATRARLLRERCLQVAAGREGDEPVVGTWEAITARLGAGRGSPASAPDPLRGVPAFRARPRALASSMLAAAAMLVICGAFLSVFDRDAPTDTAALEARWSERWDEFVSGSGARPEPSFDPFAEIPNPDVIEF